MEKFKPSDPRCINCVYFDQEVAFYGKCEVSYIRNHKGEKVLINQKKVGSQECDVEDDVTGKKMFEGIPED